MPLQTASSPPTVAAKSAKRKQPTALLFDVVGLTKPIELAALPQLTIRAEEA
jgi:hypothetical protein